MHPLARTLAALALFAPSLTAVAQRPVLTRNADEPGRNPYQQTVLFNQTAANCPNDFYCVANFDIVPAGYRLVVTYASARFVQNTGYVGAYASLMIDGYIFGPEIMLPGGTLDAVVHEYYFGGGPVTFYVEAGHTPSIAVSGGSVRRSNTAQVSIAGYLVPLS